MSLDLIFPSTVRPVAERMVREHEHNRQQAAIAKEIEADRASAREPISDDSELFIQARKPGIEGDLWGQYNRLAHRMCQLPQAPTQWLTNHEYNLKREIQNYEPPIAYALYKAIRKLFELSSRRAEFDHMFRTEAENLRLARQYQMEEAATKMRIPRFNAASFIARPKQPRYSRDRRQEQRIKCVVHDPLNPIGPIDDR